jgi:DNA-binding GntR family transcriptional regulator
LRDLEEIFPIMATLEGRVAHEVASKRTPAQLKALDALHEKLEKHAVADDVNRYYETNYVFHDQLQECAGNRWLQINQPLGRQDLERFAQRRAADAELLGKHGLIQPLARRQLVVVDLLTQQIDGLLRQ